MKRLIIVYTMFCATLLVAQDKKEPPPKEIDLQQPTEAKKTDTPLPKIDLPEFVITGTEKINLDLKSKAEEDENRVYVPGKPEPGVRNLVAEGGLSPKQTKLYSPTPAALNGKIFTGMGFYLTPQVDGWFGQHDRENSYIMNGFYSSSDGHVKNADWWHGGFGAKGKYIVPDTAGFLPYAQLSGAVDYKRESYHAYGSLAPLRKRDLSNLDVSFGIGSRYALPYRSISGVDYTGTIGFSSFGATDLGQSTESSVYLQGNATTRFFGSSFHGLLEYRTTAYTMGLPGLQSGQWLVLRANGMSLLSQSLQLSYALQQFLYRGTIGVTSGRLYPQLELRYFLTESTTFYAGFAPTVERRSLSSIIDQNRYIDFNSYVQPGDVSSAFEAGFEFAPADEFTVKAQALYRNINEFATFLDTSGAKVWEVTYLSGVHSLQTDISVLCRLNARQNITAYARYRSAKQKDSTGVLPYIPAISVGTVYNQFFDFGLHLEAVAEYVSSRYTNFERTRSTAGYVYTSVKADIGLFQHFRGYAELQNALNQQYYIWDGYRERTIYLMLGVSYNW